MNNLIVGTPLYNEDEMLWEVKIGADKGELLATVYGKTIELCLNRAEWLVGYLNDLKKI